MKYFLYSTVAVALAALVTQGCGGSSVTGAAGAGGEAGGAGTNAGAGRGGETAGTAGATAGTGGDTFQFDGSCSSPMAATCVDYHFDVGKDIAYQAYKCMMRGGTWDDANPCTATARLGGCSVVYGTPIIVTWYYDADAAAAAKASCEGSWIYE